MFILDQLSRLHMILKPFMLRRIKRDVENELSEKVLYLYAFYNLRSRRLEVVGARKKRAREKESRVSPSRARARSLLRPLLSSACNADYAF